MPSFARVVGSPLGLIRLVAEDGALTRLDLPRGEARSALPSEGQNPLNDGREITVDALAPTEEAAVLAAAARQLDEYFTGARRDFDLPLAPEGTEFQRAVWDALLEIPYGTTTSYVAIARAIGRPAASRAVGAANGANPIAIVVPCHRVIGAAGALTGYGGGLPAKRHLLALEANASGLLLGATLATTDRRRP